MILGYVHMNPGQALPSIVHMIICCPEAMKSDHYESIWIPLALAQKFKDKEIQNKFNYFWCFLELFLVKSVCLGAKKSRVNSDRHQIVDL